MKFYNEICGISHTAYHKARKRMVVNVMMQLGKHPYFRAF